MLYCLIGDDAAAIRKRVKALMPDSATDRHVIHHQTDADLERLLRLAESRSLLADQRYLCLLTTTLLQKPMTPAAVESLLLAARSKDTLLVISSLGIDRRLRSTKALLPVATVETYTLLSPWQTDALYQQAETSARAAGLELSAQALNLLVERTGNQTERLESELEKLWLWQYHTQQPLTTNVLERLVGAAAASAVELSKHLLNRSTADALACLEAVLARGDKGDSEPEILRTLDTQYRTWTRAKGLLGTGADNDTIATALKLSNPKRVFFLRRELQGVTLQRLQGAQTAILDTELALKQGQQGCLRALTLKLTA